MNKTHPECQNHEQIPEEAFQKVRLQPFHNLWMKTQRIRRTENQTWIPIYQRKYDVIFLGYLDDYDYPWVEQNFQILKLLLIILKFATKSVELIENWSFWCPNRQILCNKVRWHRGQAHEALEEIARKHPEWNILSGKKLERDEFLSVLRNTKLKKSYTLKFSIMSMNAVGR